MDTLESKLKSYSLPCSAVSTIIETVNALDKYDKLPLATKESLQAICDLYNVFFDFINTKKSLVLIGIGIPQLRITYLFPNDKLEESQRLIKRDKKRHMQNTSLLPNANNKLAIISHE